jgi:hypothetical protein
MRRDEVSRQDRRADHLGQERIEGDEVLLTDERQVSVGRQGGLELLRGFDPRKAATDDDEVLGHGGAKVTVASRAQILL